MVDRRMLFRNVWTKWHHQLIDMHICTHTHTHTYTHTHTHAHTCYANMSTQNTHRRNICGGQLSNKCSLLRHHSICVIDAQVWLWPTPHTADHSQPNTNKLVITHLKMKLPTDTMWKQITDVKTWLLYSNAWNHLTVCKKISSGSLKMLSTKCIWKSYI